MIFVVSEIGYAWELVLVPYMEYKRYGYHIDFSTITGGKPKVDPFSIVVRLIMNKVGFGISRRLSTDTKIGKALTTKLECTISIDALIQITMKGYSLRVDMDPCLI